MKSNGKEIEKAIVEKAKALGASLAGIATVADLKVAPSYEAYDKAPFYEEYKGVEWREEPPQKSPVAFVFGGVAVLVMVFQSVLVGVFGRKHQLM